MAGDVIDEARSLCEATKSCLLRGIEQIRCGTRLGDLGHAVETHACTRGFSVVAEYGGHGIGRRKHQDPHIAHTGRPGRGLRLRAGMAHTVEPILVAGSPRTLVLEDGWTVVTRDGTWAAQWEHTILVTVDGAEILARLADGMDG